MLPRLANLGRGSRSLLRRRFAFRVALRAPTPVRGCCRYHRCRV